MDTISAKTKEKLIHLGEALVDQEKARVLIPPLKNARGFWFGSGDVLEDKEGNFYLSGRYRNGGDSRIGLKAGERGLELAIFKSQDRGKTFTKILSFSKSDLSYGNREVISIERSCLHFEEDGVELYVSSEKKGIPFPQGMEQFQKSGTGIWTIDFMKADSVKKLQGQKPRALIDSKDPQFLHMKDPVVFDSREGDTIAIFCTHPFSWTSANTGFALRLKNSGVFEVPNFTFFQRGYCWDVAISRITGVLRIPRIGEFSHLPSLSLYFYDGGESMRSYKEHPQAVKRTRGYSCEEIGGLAWGMDDDFPKLERLSPHLPLFISPYGTGCSRYFQIMQTREGIFAFWQQSQSDFSQPLVMNFLKNEEIEKALS